MSSLVLWEKTGAPFGYRRMFESANSVPLLAQMVQVARDSGSKCRRYDIVSLAAYTNDGPPDFFVSFR
jgi:hypothetical protein